MKKILVTFLTAIVLFASVGNLNVYAQNTNCSNVGDTCCDAAFGAKSCGLNLQCDTTTNKCINKTCGGSGQACCSGAIAGSQTCNNSTLTCTNNVCVSSGAAACGGQGQSCCSGTIAGSQVCTGNLVCQNNSCVVSSTTGNGGTITGNSNGASITCASDSSGASINTAIGCIPFNDQNALVGFILRWAIGIAGGIAFLLILIAGFQIITSRGDPKRLQAGQELMTSAIAGVLLLIFSLVILRIIGFDILGIGAFK